MKLPKSRMSAESVFCVSLFFVFTCWAFASPNGSVPDEAFHLKSIYCYGKKLGPCEVPKFITDEPCFGWGPGGGNGAPHPDTTPACIDETSLTTKVKISTDSTNEVTNSYQGGYYGFMHNFVAESLRTTVFRIRMLNTAICSTVIFLILRISRHRQNLARAFIFAVVATYVPLAFYFIPSVSTASWSFIGPTASWVPLLILFDSAAQRKEKIRASFIVLICLLLSFASKPEALIYTFLVFLSTFLLSNKSFKIKIELIVVTLAILRPLFELTTTISPNARVVLYGFDYSEATTFFSLYYTSHNLPKIISLYAGQWAQTLGDTDFTTPSTTMLLSFVAMSTILIIGFRSFSKYKFLVISLYLFLMTAVPIVILNLSQRQVGAYITARYLWAMLFGLLFVANWTASRNFVSDQSKQVAIACGAANFAAIGALFAVLRRYTVGASSTSWNLDADKLWWWDTPITPLTLLGLAFVMQTIFFGSAYKILTRTEETDVPLPLSSPSR